MIHLKRAASFLCVALLLAGCATSKDSSSTTASSSRVKITDVGGKLRVEIGGQLFTEYHYTNVSRPYLYPIIGPGGAPMTRNWPMKEVPDEERDHVHHKSWWYAHGDVNGHDFWSESAKAGTTVHDKFIEVRSGHRHGIIKTSNKLVAKDGSIIATDTRTLQFYYFPTARFFDFEITIHASHGDLVLGDTKEGTMAIRLAETMRLKGKVGKGTIVNSEGVRNGDTWGKRARWVDYYGPVNGQTVGVAIMDHPNNPRYPTWWHVRDYGLFAANPFGLHDFEKKGPGAGAMAIAKGKSVSFRYRFYFHSGDEKEAQVAERHLEFIGQATSTPP